MSTESWAKYFISTDADIKLVTKKLFRIVGFCVCVRVFGWVFFVCFVLFAGFNFIFLKNLLLNLGVLKEKR